jgi:hypothetical protein
VSSLQDPIVLTEDSQLAVPFTMFDPDMTWISLFSLSQISIYGLLRNAAR